MNVHQPVASKHVLQWRTTVLLGCAELVAGVVGEALLQLSVHLPPDLTR